jgi:hypothetical protein
MLPFKLRIGKVKPPYNTGGLSIIIPNNNNQLELGGVRLVLFGRRSRYVSCGTCGVSGNARTFTRGKKTLPALKFSFLQALFEWLKNSNSVSFTSMLEMLDSCSVCT